MANRIGRVLCWTYALMAWAVCAGAGAQPPAPPPAGEAGNSEPLQPAKVYVPYEKLRAVFESEKQGVFLPYNEFERLWRLAAGAPAEVREAPTPFLISTARITGKVGEEVARMQLELTVDVLADGWVEAPIGLGDVAVVQAAFTDETSAKAQPLLRVTDGQYRLLVKGKGRRVLQVDFARQLASQPGLKVLDFRMPPAAITTLELLIPEENVKVDVEPMLAAAATPAEQDGKKITRLQAFLGASPQVKLSWKPKTEAAAELEPVVISDLLQHVHVAEALIEYTVTTTLEIRRRGVDAFTLQLPGGFRVTSVEGANLSKWDIQAPPAPAAAEPATQNLQVQLFSPARDSYVLTVKMERFLKEPEVKLALAPVLVQQALRQTGLLAITHSPRRSVEVTDPKDLSRVDVERLPENVRKQPGVIAYRFVVADYAGTLAIGTVAPRITVEQLWGIGVRGDRLELHGRLNYRVERSGIFQVMMNLPEPWEIVSLGPPELVDDHQLSGQGAQRKVSILLKRELTGSFALNLEARAPRAAPDADVDFSLPLADAENLQLYSGQLLLLLAEQFRAEQVGAEQLQSLPVARATRWISPPDLIAAMALEFRAVDRAKPAGAKFRIAVKPAQVSAVVHRLVSIEPGSLTQEAVIDYQVRYAPVDTFYLMMPAALADAGAQIIGADIKENPRLDKLPPGESGPVTTAPGAATRPGENWTYYKVVLQSPRIGAYPLRVSVRQPFQAAQAGEPTTVVVEPILAAGRLLSDQSGHIAIAKAETLAIGEPTSTNLVPADATSAVDLPHAPHRRVASLAFKYTALPFSLTLPVVAQKEAAVFATIARGVVVEQVLARDGRLNAHAIFLLATSRGDRLTVRLPEGADLFAVLLNGTEAPVELTTAPNERVVRLPPSAGQVARFVLEVSYGLSGASRRRLAAPTFTEGIPVQQTLWRLWVPEEDYVLGYDRDFSPLSVRQADSLIQTLGEGQPSAVAFKLAPQGRQMSFLRQGAPGTLRMHLAGKEVFGIVVWVIVLAAGVAMLRLTVFQRCLIVLGAAVAAAIVRMFAPLLVRHVVLVGAPAGVIVLLLWVAYWMFLRRLEARRVRPATVGPSAPGPAAPAPPTDKPAQGDAGQPSKEA